MAQNNSVVAVYPSNDSLDLVGPAWTRFTDSGSGATLAIAQGAGSSSLKFKGTQIEVYGVLEPGPPVTSTYSIDGSSAESYTGPSDLTSSQSEVPFFLSPTLSSGEHELTINVINATANASYVLEFILYIPTSTGASNATYSSTSLRINGNNRSCQCQHQQRSACRSDRRRRSRRRSGADDPRPGHLLLHEAEASEPRETILLPRGRGRGDASGWSHRTR
ncbi:uncharacterized protein B0H18DRAFT_290704 [Fomitopsis serialis]|uniref:uncharacterized protein n=1 Tax=Fomitopsis serialis TaxID=139415 RepID=UPI0020078A68|nr:uncharacterized protein B0H18DRAFT_290704 [Neoantrodia serialis]KAH9927234.1 hypothetical protein B0H18DRAFT_290704 [Neoantrodia serialis]